MTLLELRPMLQTEDYQGTLDFYTHTLGFECTSSIPGLGWASLKRDRIALMISRPNSHTPFGGPRLTGSIYINTDDVEGWWARLKDVARVAYPIETMEYDMREFGILDNNGYLLQFGQPVEVPV
jgi:uncharacterized glyoxalase superfamily protein PhnB